MPSLRSFPDPPGLGIIRSRTGSGRNEPSFEGAPQVVQEPGYARHLPDVVGGYAVDAGGVRALVARDPVLTCPAYPRPPMRG
jgi:hypothetical protein